ncbi:hypothetical protein SORBI_3004G212350 [Sorghum bicolor]|uniref:Uncharacterized protein n=1 Tax=Sorghum bicolor TaxID=4558 RepID=A0A1Z5RPI3_SORBI|nr:hypothetical protein SORBI_3004G212350 [Sorghum bicolor]
MRSNFLHYKSAALNQPASHAAPSRGGANVPAPPPSRPGGNRTTVRQHRAISSATSGSSETSLIQAGSNRHLQPTLAMVCSFHPSTPPIVHMNLISYDLRILPSVECGFSTCKSIYKHLQFSIFRANFC